MYCTQDGAHFITDVNYSEHVKADGNTRCDGDHCVVEYLPASDCSQLFQCFVHFHLHRQQQQQQCLGAHVRVAVSEGIKQHQYTNRKIN